jgi:hypothetical protein
MPTSTLGTGLAAFPAGVGPAGHDPDEKPTTLPKQTPIPALAFDPYARVYVRNADGTMAAGTGPIHRAAHLMLPRGSIAATPNEGLDVQAIRRATPESRLTVIKDAVYRTWKVLIESRQIAVGRIFVLEPGPPWSGKFEVEVVDLVNKIDPMTIEGKA